MAGKNHILRRSSAITAPYKGTCIYCGRTDLTDKDGTQECPVRMAQAESETESEPKSAPKATSPFEDSSL